MFNQLLIGLLALLGFAGCEETGADEYGTPLAEYRVKGKVIDAETKQPITGMQVVSGVLFDPADRLYQFQADTVYSDGKGEFEVVHQGFPGKVYRVIWEDIREATEYRKDSTDLVITGKYTDGTGWYKGYMALEVEIEAKK